MCMKPNSPGINPMKGNEAILYANWTVFLTLTEQDSKEELYSAAWAHFGNL